MRKTLVEALKVLIGKKGKDWEDSITWKPYWMKWGELNRN